VKCPKCGFVSYAGIAQCKKCGYAFVKAAPKGSCSRPASSSRETAPPPSPPAKAVTAVSQPNATLVEPQAAAREIPPPAPVSPASMPISSQPVEAPSARAPENLSPDLAPALDLWKVDGLAPDWKDELSERVDTFRKRRARLQRNADEPENLELDFEGSGEPRGPAERISLAEPREIPGDNDAGFDVEFADTLVPDPNAPPLSTTPRAELGESLMVLGTAPVEGEERSWGDPQPESRPMEIVVGSPEEALARGDKESGTGFLVPVGRRFLAGSADAAVLGLGVTLFGFIFWMSRGRLSPSPLNFAVLGFMVVLLIFAYFGLFTALTATTPGLLWMGCGIRNAQGANPTPRESFWRAFGVLVSLAALMLGFIWACVDSEGLTWHDRMSGTFIAPAHTSEETEEVRAEP